MKTLRRLCLGASLLTVLSVSASAGEIHTDFVPPPPPPPSVSATATEPSGISASEMQSPFESDSVMTEFAFAIVQLLTAL